MDNFDLRKYLAENKITSNSKAISEQADHVSPMVAKAYKDYIKAKKDSAADVDFAEDPEKAYRYYSKKLNNTYSTRADRDAIEAILKKKYGSALEEQDTITKMNEGKGRDEARKIIDHLRSKVFKNLSDDELDEFRKEIANAFDIKESINEDTQSELDKWEGRLYDLENMNRLSNNPDPIKQKKAIEAVKKKIASLKKKSEMNEIKGFEEFKETGFKLGDKVVFMGSAHPTHTKPIKLTGTIEYFEPADEIGVRVDGYGKFIPFFEIQSNIELIN